MSENLKDVTAERDALRVEVDAKTAEVEQLRGQLAAAGATRVAAPTHVFQLSQGDLADLESFGSVVIGGERLTTAQVRERLTGAQKGLKIKDASAPVDVPEVPERAKIEGVDFIKVPTEPGLNAPAAAPVAK